MSTRQKLVCMASPKLSIRKQCDLLCVHRSGLYYQPQEEKPGECEDDEFNGSPLVDPSHGRG